MTPGGERLYYDLTYWISFATFAGLPATSFPVGLSDAGLPIGMQMIGPFMEDATPITLAGEISALMGMPQWPKGYD